MLEHALQYAGRGWRVFPTHTPTAGGCSCGRPTCTDVGKHPRIKAWQKAATTDAAQIHKWWTKWPSANIGIATGQGLIVLDLDGREEFLRFQAIAQASGGLPPTLVARTGRGLHLYLSGSIGGSHKVDGLLVRGDGGYVIAPPSRHANGSTYQWLNQNASSPAPAWFISWAQALENKQPTQSGELAQLGQVPDFLQAKQRTRNKVSSGLAATPWSATEEARIKDALTAISPDCDRDTWLYVGMALHALDWNDRPDGVDQGFLIWNDWSATAHSKYQGEHDLQVRWRSFGERTNQITLGTLYHLAQQHGWRGLAPQQAPAPFVDAAQAPPPSRTPPAAGDVPYTNGFVLPESITAPAKSDSPLIQMNEKYAVIGDVGGKCLVLGWVPSKIDNTLQVPSFQTFRSFTERFSHKYVAIRVPKDEGWKEEIKPLGAQWLKWPHRTSYEAIDMVPNAPPLLPGNILNLWKGFAVAPAAGDWSLMKRHISEVLANNDPECLTYIMKWAAWKLQHPGERAEVALVFKGDKGSGKGTFANALKRIFGPHGMQIFSSKHMTGQFNAHLRSCLLLYADEAFWAGDKQGESVLKGMLTEPTLMIEQKGIDPTPWTNRLGVIMAANADWVVPAGQKERRYAVFNVNGFYSGNYDYFEDLYDEINHGGLEAMMYDLLRVDLRGWHPRFVPQTQALQEQKFRTFDTRYEWFENMLSEGILRGSLPDLPMVSAQALYNDFIDNSPGNKHCSKAAFGNFLREQGCIKLHGAQGNRWRFRTLKEHREHWVQRFGAWTWSDPAVVDWQTK